MNFRRRLKSHLNHDLKPFGWLFFSLLAVALIVAFSFLIPFLTV